MAGNERTPGDSAADLSDDDLALWQHVTKDAAPLKKRDIPKHDAPPGGADAETGIPAPSRSTAPGSASKPAPPRPARPAPADLGHGDVAGVDRRTVARMKRGQLPIDAALDLHGHTQAEAHGALDRFLAGAQARGLRCVLVITGKGVTKEAGGVLRAQVPRWLNEAANRARILAFDYAQPKDGGMGALYVLLRRKRGD